MGKNSRTSTLWIIVFFLGTIFQYWRGSQIDTLVYAIVTGLLLFASQDIWDIPNLRAVSFRVSVMILIVCTAVFIFSPIHRIPSTVFYLALIPLMLKNMWRGDAQGYEPSTPAFRRASWLWFTIGLLTCLVELGNYFAADLTHNDKSYPTITVLVDPLLANNAGKIFFIFLWSMIGVGLFRVSVKK